MGRFLLYTIVDGGGYSSSKYDRFHVNHLPHVRLRTDAAFLVNEDVARKNVTPLF